MTDIYETVTIQSDAGPSPDQGVTKPGLDTESVPQSSEFSADMGDTPREAQSTSGKKVVRVVRRVVRRVLPAGTEQQSQPVSDAATAAAKSTKASAEDGDDISVGLASLMGRGRTKEHRPRTRTQDRKDDVKEEMKQEENKEGAEEEEEMPAVEITQEPAFAKTVTPPVPKADPLAPPPGFIPVPKQNLLTPPPGFIPARKASPGPSKQNPLARPPGFIPITRTDPLAPPAGFIPKPRPFSIKKPEVLRAKLALLFNSWWSMTDDINIHLQPSYSVTQITRKRGEQSGLMSRYESVLMACSQVVRSLRVVCEH